MAGENFSSLDLSTFNQYLSPAESALFNEMRIPKRKREWLLGRLTAKSLLTTLGLPLERIPFDQLTIGNETEGAPFLPEYPQSGSFSITHREQVAACAFTAEPGVQVGIDLEWVEPRQFSFVEDFFTREEVLFIQHLDGGDAIHDAVVTLIWSAKEAILKAWRKGLRLDTRQIEILPAVDIMYQLDFGSSTDWRPLNWRAKVPGYPDCWLGWRRWENFILTLAVTTQENRSPAMPEIKFLSLDNFPL